ncbi:MAG TPA: ABC transporter ATP-binding protein [Aggregatilineales bacterium]|nr:ABC transporter ATP-binding protein [Aggregatilineales bacterium]
MEAYLLNMQDRQKTVISIEGVEKKYRSADGTLVHALDNINLNIHEGEFISFIGPSGCGKSTLLRLVADLIPPSQGKLTINGHSAHEARRNREYGFVFQSATLYDWRTVIKNVQLPLEVMEYPRRERDRRAHEMLELVELTDFANHYPWQLSGGMQQRVSIARALAFEPQLLLMDEPFGALDEMTRERLNNELLQIWSNLPSMTILFVTHNIAEAVYLSSRVVVMSPRPGRIKEIVDINLPRPRTAETLDTDEYFHHTNAIRHLLREGME